MSARPAAGIRALGWALACGVAALVAAPRADAQDFQALLERLDEMDDTEHHTEALTLLQRSLPRARSAVDRAELHWRMARAHVGMGDDMQDGGATQAELLALFEEGETYADRAIAEAPNSHLGYYWKSASIGKWGQAKGVLNALAAAGRMRALLRQVIDRAPDYAPTYYVLGSMYDQLPGFPLSFGNADWAVSFGRRAIDLREAELEAGLVDEVRPDYYTELAKHLFKRNWNQAKREREQQRKRNRARNEERGLELAALYEGEVDIAALDDREEAAQLLQRAMQLLRAQPTLSREDQRDLQDAIEVQARL